MMAARTSFFIAATLVAITLATAPAAAQTAPPEASAELLVGMWDADFDALLAAEDMSEEDRALATAMLRSARMQVAFDADGTMRMRGEMMGQEQSESGTWESIRASGAELVISGTTDDGETQSFTVVFETNDTMTVSDESGEPIPFVRTEVVYAPSTSPDAPEVAEPRRMNRLSAATTAASSPSGVDATIELLLGAWRADFEALLERQTMSEEERSMANAMLGSAEMVVFFEPDGTASIQGEMMGQEQSESGFWTLQEARGDTLYLLMEMEGDDPETFTFSFRSHDELDMSNSDGRAIPFVRVTEEP